MIASFFARACNKLRLIHRYGLNDLIPISKFNTSFRIKINGTLFRIPVLNKTGWENLFLTEGWFSGLMIYLDATKDWTIIDIGANIGQTLLKVKSIYKEIEYLGFEPNPVCVNYLYKLIAKNKINRVILFPVGISKKTQLLEFYYYNDSETDPSASIIPGYRPGYNVKKTNIVPVSDINEIRQIRELSKLDLIKIDVEGAEMEVMQSCEELIIKHKPYIIIEILPVYSSDNVIRNQRQNQIETFIKRLNYKIFLIKKGTNEKLEMLEERDEIGIHGDILNIDYLLVPDKVNLTKG